jgi:hypothetical protein
VSEEIKISKREYSYRGKNIVVHKTALDQVSTRGGCGWYATVDGVICEESKGSGTKRLAVTFAKAMIDSAS